MKRGSYHRPNFAAIAPLSMTKPLTAGDFQQTADRSLIDELIGSVASGTPRHRVRVLQRVTDLFVAGSRRYSNEQIALFDDVLQKLATEIEYKARVKLAQRLAYLESAPPRLMRSLAFDDAIGVAGPVLANSPQLSDDDLAENAASKSQDHLQAIAQRISLSEKVTDVLVDRGNRRVVRTVAANRGARFSLAGYGKLTARARYDRKLTLTLGQRSDIPRQFFLKLVENASAAVRAKLIAGNPELAAAIRDVVGVVAGAIQKDSREASPEYVTAARDAKRRFSGHDVTEHNVHAPARAQEFEKTVLALARLGRFPVDIVERALIDEGDDMVLVLARAAGCSWATTKELLAMYAAGRKLGPDEMARSYERFEQLSRETAQSVVDYHLRRMDRLNALTARAAEAAERGSAPVPADLSNA